MRKLSFKPELMQLENRVQPGSMLVSNVDLSLLAGGIAPLDFQDQAQDQRLPAVSPAQPGVNPAETVATVSPGQQAAASPATFASQPVSINNTPVDPVLAAGLHIFNRLPAQEGKLAPQTPAPQAPDTPNLCGGGLVVNPGFETNSFAGWTTNIVSSTFVGSAPNPPHTGAVAAQLGAVGGDDTFWQDLPTSVGTYYLVSFWYYSDGGTPSDINVSWGGANIYTEVNAAAHPYQYHAFFLQATAPSTRLLIGARNVPSWDAVDDVCAGGIWRP